MCRNDALRRKVNDLLIGGASYAMVLRALEQDNAKLDQRDRVTTDSIRCHTKRHFPVQNVASATYRAILEQRAKQNGVDFVNGVATAIPPMAFYETVMVKGYETLVDSDTTVDVNTGMVAACSAASADRVPGRRNPHRRPHGPRWAASSTPFTPPSRKSCGRRDPAQDRWTGRG